jgi:hypothetical protein
MFHKRAFTACPYLLQTTKVVIGSFTDLEMRGCDFKDERDAPIRRVSFYTRA